MKITNLGMIPLNGLRDYVANMEVDTERRFTVQKHGYKTTFYVQRVSDGWREQNDLYGLQEGCYGITFRSLDGFESELHSILDK
jgi:hypothetical protein